MQKSLYGKFGQEIRQNKRTGSNARADVCPSSGLKDGKVTPSTFMRTHHKDLFEQRTNYSFKKELPSLSKNANLLFKWDVKQTYKKNLDLGFVHLKGDDLNHFFRDVGCSRGKDRFGFDLAKDSFAVRKYGPEARLLLDPYYTSKERFQNQIVWKSKLPIQGHRNLNDTNHFNRCDLFLTSKIMCSYPSRRQERKYRNFYINACHIMEKIPKNWYENLSMEWLEKKKFINIRRPQELKKSLLMSGELLVQHVV